MAATVRDEPTGGAPLRRRAAAWWALFVALPLAGLFGGLLAPRPASAHPVEAEAFPPPPVSFRVIAPSAKGPWLLRVDNEGDQPVRIAADVRLLRFEVRAPAADKTPKSLVHQGGWQRRATVCDGPSIFGIGDHFPVGRELILEPGHSFVEEFDPRLICFDDDAKLLVPGAMVKAYYGWLPNKKPWMKMSVAPFVADAARVPRKYKPLRRLEAPTMVLSHAPPVEYGPVERRATATERREAEEAKARDAARARATDRTEGRRPRGRRGGTEREGSGGGDRGGEDASGGARPDEPTVPQRRTPRTADEASEYQPRVPSPKEPVAPKDELGARMTLTADRYADAHRPTDIVVNVQAHNVGERPIFVALRPRMLSFVVAGPNGVVKCPRASVNHKVPRDLFNNLQHDKHVHMVVLLAEVCPPGTFERPGLYAAVPTLHADATGAEYGFEALTGEVTVRDPGNPSGMHEAGDDVVLIRKRRGALPFYPRPPTAIPTRVLPE